MKTWPLLVLLLATVCLAMAKKKSSKDLLDFASNPSELDTDSDDSSNRNTDSDDDSDDHRRNRNRCNGQGLIFGGRRRLFPGLPLPLPLPIPFPPFPLPLPPVIFDLARNNNRRLSLKTDDRKNQAKDRKKVQEEMKNDVKKHVRENSDGTDTLTGRNIYVKKTRKDRGRYHIYNREHSIIVKTPEGKKYKVDREEGKKNTYDLRSVTADSYTIKIKDYQVTLVVKSL